MKSTILRLSLILIAVCISGSGVPESRKLSGQLPYDKAAAEWVENEMAKLTTLRQQVAQLFVPRLDISDNPAGRTLLKKMVATDGVGGILLGKGTIEGYASLINLAQSEARIPLMITLDGEWGLSMRVADTPRFPYNMGLGAIQDENLLFEYGRETARECRELGIHVDFAPVLDVNSNPANPVIGYRSFGENPEQVARLGVAYSRGMETGTVMSVAKHFPGHGDTSTDSHKTLPVVDHDLTKLKEVDLLPFQAFIDAGLSGIMVGHLKVPVLDAAGTPASLSKAITTGLLVDEMGFNGMVFTDALAMKGAVSGLNNCVAALMAGADVLLGSGAPSTDIDAVVAAVESGKITRETIETKCRKMLRYKYSLGLADYSPIDTNGLRGRINSQEAQALNQRLANASVTVLFNKDGLLPLSSDKSRNIALLSIGAPADNQFSDMCGKYAQVHKYAIDGTAEIPAATMSAIRKADVVIVGVFKDAAWARQAYGKVQDLQNVVPVFFMNPYKMAKFGTGLANRPELMLAYDDTPELRKAAAMAIFGGIGVNGKLPVNLKGIAPIGTGAEYDKVRLGYSTPEEQDISASMLGRVDSIIAQAIKQKAFPGCQILVAKGGNIVMDKCYGTLDYVNGKAVTDATLYDIASMSKAISTLSGLMKAYDEEMFALDDKASKHIPGLVGTDKENIKVRELLYHESGMPAVLNMNKLMVDHSTYTPPLTRSRASELYPVKIANGVYAHRDAKIRKDIASGKYSEEMPVEAAKGIYVGDEAYDSIMTAIYNAPLRKNKSYRYSCLNFCLLMEMEENLTGEEHDVWMEREIFVPMGLSRIGYRPSSWYDVAKIAPTEKDNFLRKQTLQGYVHDEMAAFSGGVQGNAGLFANAKDIAAICQMLLNRGEYAGKRILSEKTVELFTKTKSPTANRGLGFDKLKVTDGVTESGAPVSTYGHTGFTGTCFWVDPENEIIFVFLSNRVHPSRVNQAFSSLKPREAVMSEIYRSLQKK